MALSNNGKAAIAYAERLGWPVFPCNGKIPFTKSGFKDATADPDQIGELWDMHPDANIGVPTGSATGFDVLDIDPRHGGDESLEDLEEDHDTLPETAEQLTGGGGRHILFRHEDGITNSSGNLPSGMDVRGEGGYIIVSPSIHQNGTQYRWEDSSRPDEVELATWPKWLVTLLKPSNGKIITAPIASDIPEGQRNTVLTSLAGTMRRRNMGEASILEALRVENRSRCKPPLPDSEVCRIARSSMRYPAESEVSEVQIELSALRCVADVEPEAVEWLWEPRIPLRHLTALEGDPGEGKSFITQAIAAKLSRGMGLPGAPENTPANSLLLTGEDYVPTSVRPRLGAMGAELNRIYTYDRIVSLDDTGLKILESLIKCTSARFVVIDPIQAFLPPELDIHRANQVRAVMAGLGELAERCDCAVLIVRHLAKGSASKAIYRGLGSIDFTAACRSVLLAGHDSDDQNARGLVQIKSNLGPIAEAVGYSIELGQFQWTGSTPITAGRILAAEIEDSALGDAKGFLLEILAAGPKPVKVIQEEATAALIKWATLRRAKEALKIQASKEGFEGGWVWKLTEDAQGAQP